MFLNVKSVKLIIFSYCWFKYLFGLSQKSFWIAKDSLIRLSALFSLSNLEGFEKTDWGFIVESSVCEPGLLKDTPIKLNLDLNKYNRYKFESSIEK